MTQHQTQAVETGSKATTATETRVTDQARMTDPEVRIHRPKPHRSIAYKRRILQALDACTQGSERGAILRREGLYSSRITAWKKARSEGKLEVAAKRTASANPSPLQKLTQENHQLKKKLAQAEAIIDIQKKVSALFGMENPFHLNPEQS